MKRPLAWVAAAGVVTGILVLLLAWRLWTGSGPGVPLDGREGPQAQTTLVRITPGMTLRAAADTLAARGLLEHPVILLAGARINGLQRGLKAGLYELSFGSSPRDLLEAVTSGQGVQMKVTIPEGLDAEEIAAIIADGLGFDAAAFLAAADSLVEAAALAGDLLGPDEWSAAAYDSLLKAESTRHNRRFHWCEGHLAPDTFRFAEGTGADQAARFLVETQWARVDSVLAEAGGQDSLGLSRQGLITLASIVEAEARLDEERTLIAAVYVNRLEKGRRLEADPTVAFILGKKGRRLFYRDLEVESPFNTYRNRGLPPGPIGSPGSASLRAAAQPDSTCRAMYFVSDGRGGHVFSVTAKEHEKAVREFRRLRAEDQRDPND